MSGRHLPRVVDLALATCASALLWPMWALSGVLIKLDSPGAVFFTQWRVGKDGNPFRIIKLRTMTSDHRGRGTLTIGQDPRVTRVGRVLRRWRLDETPQLLNILQGTMALVGPRPETPDHVAHYTESQRRVLDVLPGLTSETTLAFSHEAELLAESDDPERFYLEFLMPKKVDGELRYLSRRTLTSDARVLVETALAFLGLHQPEKVGLS